MYPWWFFPITKKNTLFEKFFFTLQGFFPWIICLKMDGTLQLDVIFPVIFNGGGEINQPYWWDGRFRILHLPQKKTKPKFP